jgi:acyl-CoA thioesterase
MTALPIANEGVRSRVISWSDPARTRFHLRGRDGIDRLKAFVNGEVSPVPAAALLGMEITEVERGRVVFELVADEIHENPMGTMHGGVVATLVDVVMASAAVSKIGFTRTAVTLNLNTAYLQPGLGRLTADGEVLDTSGDIVQCRAVVTDESGRTVARAIGSFKYLDRLT